jgi:outer membrane protein assembly factor BamB
VARSARRATAPIILTVLLVTLVTGAGAAPTDARSERSGGEVVWARRYDSGPGPDDSANAVAASPDGSRVFVTGESHDDFLTVAYDASTGSVQWARRSSAPVDGDNLANAIAVSPDSATVFVTGESGYSTRTFAYDAATGTPVWARTYNGNAYGRQAIAVTPDGATVIVIGASRGDATLDDILTIAYRASTGATLWMRRYNGPADQSDNGNAVVVSPDGSKVFVAGEAGNGWGDFLALAYDATTGEQLWTRRNDGPRSYGDAAEAVAASPDGEEVFVTGWSSGTESAQDYLTVAFDAGTGTVLWTRRYNGPWNSTDTGTEVAVSPNGSTVFVTGSSRGNTSSSDYATIAYDAHTGTVRWLTRYDGPLSAPLDQVWGMVVVPDGSKVIVTGQSQDWFYADYLTIAYDAATGTELWARRYNGPADGNDVAHGIATNHDGSLIFVTGESPGRGNDGDYFTVAYRARP